MAEKYKRTREVWDASDSHAGEQNEDIWSWKAVVVDGGMSGGCGGRCLGGGSLRGQGSIFLRDPISTGPASSLSRKRVTGLAFKSKGTQRGVQIKAAGPRNTFPAFRHYPISIILTVHTLRSRLRPPQSFTFRPNTHFHGLVRRRKGGRIYRYSSHGPKVSFMQLGLPISATLLDQHPEYPYHAAGMSKLVLTSSAMHSGKSCRVIGRIL